MRTMLDSPASRLQSRHTCRVFEEDPDLCANLGDADRQRATRDCVAAEIRLSPGLWSAESVSEAIGHGLGLLVLAGLLSRRVQADGRAGGELLGDGDLLRPWEDDGAVSTVPLDATWRVLAPTRLAILDLRFAARAAAFPELTGAFAGRALRRARNLAANMAIVHSPRVDVRLHMLFWRLADRWGTVHVDGIRVTLPLTHEALSDLVAARRPTVTTALTELSRRGVVERVGDTWCLYGEPPGELLEVEAPTWAPDVRGSGHRRIPPGI